MKTTIKIWKQIFLNDERGSVLPLFGLILASIVVATGIAIDYGRAQMVQSKLHAALDAAGLAAGATAKSRNIENEVHKYVEANFPQGYMETDYAVTKIEVRENPANSSVTIDLKAEGEMKTSFMNAFAFSSVGVEASTEVTQSRRRGFELVMVLDNSGSMGTRHGGITRTTSMVNAANDMLDMVYGTANFYNNMFVGLVPFNHAVKVGGAKVLTSDWLREDEDSFAPIPGDVRCVYTNMSGPANRGGDHTLTPTRDLSYATSDDPPYNSASLFMADRTDNACGVVEMTAMQNTKSDIRDALSNMDSDGNTRIDMGAVWGWRMLSPKWRGLWNHEGPGLPLNYNSEDMDKVMILLTDGENCCGSTAVAEADDRLMQVCQSAKQQGIHMYTIGFCLTDAHTQGLLRSCATSNDHYFFTCGNQGISDVFKKIADSLMNLRISR